MVEIKITSYKPSGKYYDGKVIKINKNINIWDDEFYQILLDNCPYKGGFIVVDDINIDKHDKFYQGLFKYEDIVDRLRSK